MPKTKHTVCLLGRLILLVMSLTTSIELLWTFPHYIGNNFNDSLAQIGEVVRNMQNQNVQLKIKRDEQLLDLVLVPKTWTGRGLLGCNIVLPPEPMES